MSYGPMSFRGARDDLDHLRSTLLEGANIIFKISPNKSSTSYGDESPTPRKVRAKTIKKYEHHVLCDVRGEVNPAVTHREAFNYFDILKGDWKYGL